MKTIATQSMHNNQQYCLYCGVATDKLNHIGALPVYCCGAYACDRELRREQGVFRKEQDGNRDTWNAG